MINKDIKCYFDEEMRDYIDPIKIISLPETQNNTNSPKPPLVNMHESMYNFDKICKNLYKLPPKSADGIFFCKRTMYIVEFKTGFKRKPENKSENLASLCTKYNEVCEEWKEWQNDRFKRKQAELRTSIRLKAVESYITLEKQFFPLCKNAEKRYRIVFIVVTDMDSVNEYDSTLGGLSKKHISVQTSQNELVALNNSLKSYNCKQDKHDPCEDYFYDEIKVMSANTFKSFYQKLSPTQINPSNYELQNVLN